MRLIWTNLNNRYYIYTKLFFLSIWLNNWLTMHQVIVPSTTCLWVVAIYLLLGTIMFAEWEGWNYMDSIYFCVTSLTKIGFGDLVPGTSDHDSTMHEVKLVINFVYILLGMAIVAMCYYLLKEEVTVKLTQFEDKMKDKIWVFKQKVSMNKKWIDAFWIQLSTKFLLSGTLLLESSHNLSQRLPQLLTCFVYVLEIKVSNSNLVQNVDWFTIFVHYFAWHSLWKLSQYRCIDCWWLGHRRLGMFWEYYNQNSKHW